ncbi:MAG TPA: RloB family protein [Terriglobia bacterium]|nr:RloB family protein [Terriglobia bacterium]
MPRRRDDLRRRRAFTEPRPSVLICCEGEVTEPTYLNGLKNELRIRLVRIQVVPVGQDPKKLVDYAVDEKRRSEREARKSGDANLEYDEVWCVFDVDSHAHIPDAKQKANANGIHLAISNPCFELWLLLHFENRTAHIERQQAQSCCRGHMPRYEKEVPFNQIFPFYQLAVQRAWDLEHWQATRGNQGGNPSTGVHRLTERVKELGREEQLKKHQHTRR